MEIDVTQIIAGFDPFDYSRSRFEGGDNAGRGTWNNAKRDALALFGEQFDREAFDAYFSGFGAWDDDELAAHTDEESAALMLQFIAGDYRECEGLIDEEEGSAEWWVEYERLASAGTVSGRFGRGDDGRVWYYVGE
jgi:hypothetical protein